MNRYFVFLETEGDPQPHLVDIIEAKKWRSRIEEIRKQNLPGKLIVTKAMQL